MNIYCAAVKQFANSFSAALSNRHPRDGLSSKHRRTPNTIRHPKIPTSFEDLDYLDKSWKFGASVSYKYFEYNLIRVVSSTQSIKVTSKAYKTSKILK